MHKVFRDRHLIVGDFIHSPVSNACLDMSPNRDVREIVFHVFGEIFRYRFMKRSLVSFARKNRIAFTLYDLLCNLALAVRSIDRYDRSFNFDTV